MKPLDCVDVRDVAPEFALGVLDGDLRAEVVLHLDACAACRNAVTELVEAADSIVLTAPEAEPPPGFERRVLARLTGDDRRRRWRTVKLVAAVAAAAAIVSIATVRVVDRSRTDADVTPAAVTVAMTGDDGARVGEVEVVDDGAMATMALTVDYALPDGSYRVALDSAAADRQVLGMVTVTGGRGSWSGSAVVGDEPTNLALVDAAGRVQCSARLPTA